MVRDLGAGDDGTAAGHQRPAISVPAISGPAISGWQLADFCS